MKGAIQCMEQAKQGASKLRAPDNKKTTQFMEPPNSGSHPIKGATQSLEPLNEGGHPIQGPPYE